MKMVFMGTPEIAAIILKSIIDSGKHEICAVVTQTDKPKGRGQEMAMSEVKTVALQNGLTVLQPEKASDPAFLEKIGGYAPDVIVVAAYGKILKKALLDIPKYGCINVHASLLPAYRGASPIQWAVINGEEKSGVTIMHMAEGLDTGDMIMSEEVILDKKETAGSLHDKLAAIGGPLLLKALDRIEDGTAERMVQDDSLANYVSVIDKSLGKIDFSSSATKIERLVRGLNPWPTAFTSVDGKLLKIWDCDVCTLKLSKDMAKAPAGTVVEVAEDSFFVMCGEGILKINAVQLEGKKRMNSADFLRGYKLSAGALLG